MMIAEIHGKLSEDSKKAEFERMEDLLTSNVFGAFSYLRPELGLLPFLKDSKNLQNDSMHLPDEIVDVEYFFWPKTTHFKREPDVFCIATARDGSTVSIIIECKYHSGISNRKNGEETESGGDQLAEQYHDLKHDHLKLSHDNLLKVKNSRDKYLLYVTADFGLPSDTLRESVQRLANLQVPSAQSNLYWVSWRNLAGMIANLSTDELPRETKALLTDLRNLLIRKNLIRFTGFASVPTVLIAEETRMFFEKRG